jgi:hypothetical protein
MSEPKKPASDALNEPSLTSQALAKDYVQRIPANLRKKVKSGQVTRAQAWQYAEQQGMPEDVFIEAWKLLGGKE